MQSLRYVLFLPLIAALAAISGCNGSTSNSSATPNATLNLYVADTPMDNATHVNIVFTGVEIQGADSTSGSMGMMGSGASSTLTFNFAAPKTIDLMAHQGGNNAALLTGATLPAGSYQWVRLMIDSSQSTITLSNGTVHPLTMPSGMQTGFKLVSGFTVAAGDMADFTIDFNLRQSITLANGMYMMTPAMRMMDNMEIGGLTGTVSNTFAIGGVTVSDPACSPAVYIYSGSGITPTDINTTSSIQPVDTASIQLDNTTGNYTYVQGFLAAGNYTLAIACAANDDPSISDTLTFSATKNAGVTANRMTTIDFP